MLAFQQVEEAVLSVNANRGYEYRYSLCCDGYGFCPALVISTVVSVFW